MLIILIAAIITIVIMLIFTFRWIKRVKTASLLAQDLTKGDFGNFDKRLSENKNLFKDTKKQYLELVSASTRNDSVSFARILQSLENQNLSRKEREDIYFQAFQYYLRTNDPNKCRLYMEKIDLLGDEETTFTVNAMYDTIALHGHAYMDELLHKVRTDTSMRKGLYEALLAQVYRNQNDPADAEYYEELSRQHLTDVMGSFPNTFQ